MLEYEVNFNEDQIDEQCTEEWGAAFLWLDDDHGVEYNLSYDSGENCCAIYKTEIKDGTLNTDYNNFSHYEINFDDPFWKTNLMEEMEKVARRFWK